jgi:hypothetical protein
MRLPMGIDDRATAWRVGGLHIIDTRLSSDMRRIVCMLGVMRLNTGACSIKSK